MDSFQPPPPLLPDVVSPQVSRNNSSADPEQTTLTSCFQDTSVDMDCKPSSNMETNACFKMELHKMDHTSGFVSLSSWTPTSTMQSSSSNTFIDYSPPSMAHDKLLPPPPPPPPLPNPPQQPCFPASPVMHFNEVPHIYQPPLPLPPPRQQLYQDEFLQTTQIFNNYPIDKIVEEFSNIMSDENDRVVLANSICLLYRFSIDFEGNRGKEMCLAISASPEILSRLYLVLLNDIFNGDDPLLEYATGNLTNLSNIPEGRVTILGCNNLGYDLYEPSEGIRSLFRSLQSRDITAVIFAITAIHNLLLDGGDELKRRAEIQDIAQEQIKHGLQYIVQLLNSECIELNYQSKVIVLDCLQILAYSSDNNRLVIRARGGPSLILRIIEENLYNQHADELVGAALRVLRSLSTCVHNKNDIIKYDGFRVLTNCIKRDSYDIVKTCLWTLRNLSNLINQIRDRDYNYINFLAARLLRLMDQYAGDSCITSCALGILENLSCNNESIKQLICEHDGVNLLLNTIGMALKDDRDFEKVEEDIFDPAICALCHLTNQTHNPMLANEVKKSIVENREMFRLLQNQSMMISDNLSRTIDKLFELAGMSY